MLWSWGLTQDCNRKQSIKRTVFISLCTHDQGDGDGLNDGGPVDGGGGDDSLEVALGPGDAQHGRGAHDEGQHVGGVDVVVDIVAVTVEVLLLLLSLGLLLEVLLRLEKYDVRSSMATFVSCNSHWGCSSGSSRAEVSAGS